MKSILTFLFFATSLVASASHYDVKVDHFTTVNAIGNFAVTLIKSDVDKVSVLNDDEELDDAKIIVEVDGSELKIKIKNDAYRERELEVMVYYTSVTEVHSKRGIRLTVKETLVGDQITLNSYSGGKIKATVKCETLKCAISKGGSIKVDGVAAIAEYKISAGGAIAAIHMDVPKILAKVSMGGEVICSANGKLDIEISSGGNVSYQGEPTEYSEKITLSGKVEKLKK
jgi:hypothetical protein